MIYYCYSDDTLNSLFQMSFEDAEMSVVLDKGTLDAIMTNTEEETMKLVNKMFTEISRVLRVGGRYVCVSLAQEHILYKIIHHFNQEYVLYC